MVWVRSDQRKSRQCAFDEARRPEVRLHIELVSIQ
jgi:hypothetical protein